MDAVAMTEAAVRRSLLVVSTEPAPYKTDLYNALADVWDLEVLYMLARDWDPQAGHDFRRLPEARFRSTVESGRGWWGILRSSRTVLAEMLRKKPAHLLVCGYNGLPFIMAMLLASIRRLPFAMWVDQFNVGEPRRKTLVRSAIRCAVRRFVFRQACGIMVGGEPGRTSAILAGCPSAKVLDFPYVVDPVRLESLARAVDGPMQKTVDRPFDEVVFFSGRMIERKGLACLLAAAQHLKQQGIQFTLWVEGEGPLRSHDEQLARDFQLQDRARFLGFRQMDEHAWLLRAADIVVVPSLKDPWGIVVHEAMLMGKAVCASDQTGSAVDRIVDGVNGMIFKAADDVALADVLKRLLKSDGLRERLGAAARETAARFSPRKNAETLMEIFRVQPGGRNQGAVK
jgi:1,2-diacylglycerol 3-alpha-glucosyltransferase